MTLPKTLSSWLLGTWPPSAIWRLGVIAPILLIVFDGATTRNMHPAVALLVTVVSSIGLANDLSWGVVLEEEHMLMGGFRKKSIARRVDVESAYVSESSLLTEEYVMLVLRGRDDYRINGSAGNCKSEVWVEEINRWAQDGPIEQPE